jgi:hypothetical protein
MVGLGVQYNAPTQARKKKKRKVAFFIFIILPVVSAFSFESFQLVPESFGLLEHFLSHLVDLFLSLLELPLVCQLQTTSQLFAVLFLLQEGLDPLWQ